MTFKRSRLLNLSGSTEVDRLDEHLASVLGVFTISEVLEMMDVDEVDLLKYLIDMGVCELPEFLQMENVDGEYDMDADNE
jgi:hypothetical protein